MLWPAFDTALCNLIRAELEPFMRECAPAMVQGLYFERLSFGLARPSILGVRSVPSWNAEHLAIGALAPPLSPASAAVGGNPARFCWGFRHLAVAPAPTADVARRVQSWTWTCAGQGSLTSC